jgi:hypothetical protein
MEDLKYQFSKISNPTYNDCLKYCKLNGLCLSNVPIKYRTDDLIKICLKNNGLAIQYLDEQIDKYYKIAIKKNVTAVFYINKIQNKHYFFALDCGLSLSDIHIFMRNLDICIYAININGNNLEFVPEELHSCELYKLAVSNSGSALKYVKTQNKKICDMALRKDPSAIQYANEKYLTYDICKYVASKYKFALKYIPKYYLTNEIRNTIV